MKAIWLIAAIFPAAPTLAAKHRTSRAFTQSSTISCVRSESQTMDRSFCSNVRVTRAFHCLCPRWTVGRTSQRAQQTARAARRQTAANSPPQKTRSSGTSATASHLRSSRLRVTSLGDHGWMVESSILVVETIASGDRDGCQIAEIPGNKRNANALARAAADQVLSGNPRCLSQH